MKHGDFTHIDIPADDTGRATRFYTQLFGWSFTDSGFGDYQLFTTPVGEEGMGGGIGMRGESAPERVLSYVHVDSIDETVARAIELGGSLKAPKAEVPGMGSYATLLDSEGNEIALWERAPGR